MSTYPVGRGSRSPDLHGKLRLAALTAVILGVVLLAAAAFVLSYGGIHQIARQAGVGAELARLYPVIFDAMLVIAGAAALALRGAGWWARTYAWASLVILLAAVATGDAVHAMGTALPAQPTRAAVAITPWVLVLLAFGLLLEMLRHFRKTRGQARKAAIAAIGAGENGAHRDDGSAAGQRTAVTWASAAGSEGQALPRPRTGLDTLMGPRAGEPPAVEAAPYENGAAEEAGSHDPGSQPDPVSYGEETGYVHPESYRGEGEYSPHGDSGGPGDFAGSGGYGGPVRYPGPGGYPGPSGYPGHGGYAGHGGYPATPPDGYDEHAAPGEPRDPGGHAAGDQAAAGHHDSGPGHHDSGPGQAESRPGQAESRRGPGGGGAGQEGRHNAVQDEPGADPGLGLERMRSTPSRPEDLGHAPGSSSQDSGHAPGSSPQGLGHAPGGSTRAQGMPLEAPPRAQGGSSE